MLKIRLKYLFVFFSLIFVNGCSSIFQLSDSELSQILHLKIEELKQSPSSVFSPIEIPKGTNCEEYFLDVERKEIEISFSKEFSNQPFRENSVDKFYKSIKFHLGTDFKDYDITVKTLDVPIEELIPNVYRSITAVDSSRIFTHNNSIIGNVVRNISKPYTPILGLMDRNIALWHSHGWYYNHKLNRWMWQRARLFETVEDIGPMAFTIPYIIPMLENAGANVFVPRERDLQVNEVVIDDSDTENCTFSYINNNVWTKVDSNGYGKFENYLKNNVNPFELGGFSLIKSNMVETGFANYTPDIPASGYYAVYISYSSLKNSAEEVKYTVYHKGGETEFLVNQNMGGGTWIYLGTFNFEKGKKTNIGSVKVSNICNEEEKVITTDAIRFGGGKGIVSRKGSSSGKPKYLEAARYWLQYAGIHDTLVYSLNGDTLDYNDDYQSRGEWVNYLIGNPFGPNKNRSVNGLNIPIDVSLAFHTDAGISKSDTTIGTLAIYSITDLDSNITFPNGVSRFANRDFTDIMQTEIVNDIRAKYDPVWRRRELRDARYSEATRPNVPSILLELLSHQNFLDNKFQLDPRFRFDVSRSIYKSIAKFVAYQNNYDFIAQPLPPTHFSAVFDSLNNIELNWRAQKDLLEVTANPSGYIVYTRIGNGGFDNGVFVEANSHLIKNYKLNKIYSFKITAVNEGGESFPSEILSVCNTGSDQKPLLIINGFDRISGPATIESEKFTGFLSFYDAGVPDKRNISFTGYQHNFNSGSNWTTDDMPGHGASYANYENQIIAGNTFDFTKIHGQAILNSGYSFVSCSDESIWNGDIYLNKYPLVDVIMGEEKETPWPKTYSDLFLGKQFKTFPTSFQKEIEKYLKNGGNIFLSGAYIGTDLFYKKDSEHEDVNFGRNILKFKLDSDHAVNTGYVYTVCSELFPQLGEINFNTELNSKIYAVEAPDAIGPINNSKTILRYKDNDTSAGVAYNDEYGIISFGFPFETISSENDRNIIMKNVINYLLK